MPLSQPRTPDPQLDQEARQVATFTALGDALHVTAGLLRIAARDPVRALDEGHNTLIDSMVRRHLAANAGDEDAAAAANRVRGGAFNAMLQIAEEKHPANSADILAKVKVHARMFGEEDVIARADHVLETLPSDKAPIRELRIQPRGRPVLQASSYGSKRS